MSSKITELVWKFNWQKLLFIALIAQCTKTRNENLENSLPLLRKRPNLAIEFFEELLGAPTSMHFGISQLDLELAQTGDILLIDSSDEALKPFRSKQATFLVDSLDEFKIYLEEKGEEVIRGPAKVPTGRNMTVRHRSDR